MEDLYSYINPKTLKPSPMISEKTMACIRSHADLLNSTIIYDRDFNYNYFGFKTLERSYLLRLNGRVAERPQQMLMRVAVGIHENDVEVLFSFSSFTLLFTFTFYFFYFLFTDSFYLLLYFSHLLILDSYFILILIIMSSL